MRLFLSAAWRVPEGSMALPGRSAAASARGVDGHVRGRPGIPPEQMEHSKLIVAWGYNITWSGLHHDAGHRPRAAQRREAGRGRSKRTKIAERATCICPSGPAPTSCSRGRSPPSWSAVAGSTARSSSGTWRATRNT